MSAGCRSSSCFDIIEQGYLIKWCCVSSDPLMYFCCICTCTWRGVFSTGKKHQLFSSSGGAYSSISFHASILNLRDTERCPVQSHGVDSPSQVVSAVTDSGFRRSQAEIFLICYLIIGVKLVPFCTQILYFLIELWSLPGCIVTYGEILSSTIEIILLINLVTGRLLCLFVFKLLLDCGLGNSGSPESGTETIVAQHRILIFCQLKSMLDIVEHDLLKPHLPSITYLRLDGSIPAGQRHSIVSR